jgi:hypothetical protein
MTPLHRRETRLACILALRRDRDNPQVAECDRQTTFFDSAFMPELEQAVASSARMNRRQLSLLLVPSCRIGQITVTDRLVLKWDMRNPYSLSIPS